MNRSDGTRLRVLGLVLTAALALTACAESTDNAGHEDEAGREGTPSAEPAGDPIGRFLDDTWPEGAGGTVIAARGDEVAMCTGLGLADRAKKTAARCDTVYDIGSNTKQFTSAAVLKLEMMGKLKVTDPLSTFFDPVPADKRGITLHHLMTHTAGLRDSLGDDYEVLSREAMLDGALHSELQSPIGAQWSYSNLGYSVLAAVIEDVSGMAYEEFLAEHLFGPAGMTQTGYVLPRWERELIAVEYDETGAAMGTPLDHPWADDGPHWNLRGNGGLLSTARDMLRWHVALEGDRILSGEAKSKLFAPRVPLPVTGGEYEGFSYAYGWLVRTTDEDGRIATHSGGNDWSYSLPTRFLDSGVLVFWVTNSVSREGKWHLEDLTVELTTGIAKLVP